MGKLPGYQVGETHRAELSDLKATAFASASFAEPVFTGTGVDQESDKNSGSRRRAT